MNDRELDVLLQEFIGDVDDDRIDELVRTMRFRGTETAPPDVEAGDPGADVIELSPEHRRAPRTDRDRRGLWIILGAAAALLLVMIIVGVARHRDIPPAIKTHLPKPSTTYISPDRWAAVDAINSVRTSAHESPGHASNTVAALDADATLMDLAQRWSDHMARAGKTSKANVDAISKPCWERIGQNEGSGPTPTKVLQTFLDEPIGSMGGTPRSNLLDGGYTDVGIGITKVGDTYWVAQFFLASCASVSSEPYTSTGFNSVAEYTSVVAGRSHPSGTELAHPPSPDEAYVLQALDRSRQQKGLTALRPITATCFAYHSHEDFLLRIPASAGALAASEGDWSDELGWPDIENGSLTQGAIRVGQRSGRLLLTIDLIAPC